MPALAVLLAPSTYLMRCEACCSFATTDMVWNSSLLFLLQYLLFGFLIAHLFWIWPKRRWAQYRKLRHFSGPRVAAWSELWLFNAARQGDFHLVAEGLFCEYGKGIHWRVRNSSSGF